ncbi:MAG: winged helix-turn-helix transcriptional regulator [Lachnospiraceae bacterium]|nr:winged helix-turn-helix transcriptional regulator [Lachnospiraceae bacterium]
MKVLSEREKAIIVLLRDEPTLTRAKMAEILGCSDATVKRALQSLVQKKVIRRIGSNKKGEWMPTKTKGFLLKVPQRSLDLSKKISTC